MTVDSVQTMIQKEIGVLLYFSGEQCHVCHALRPKIKALFAQTFPKIKQIYLDAQEYAEISAQYQVLSLPTILVFLDGKEFIRDGRSVSLHQLTEKLQRPYRMMTED